MIRVLKPFALRSVLLRTAFSGPIGANAANAGVRDAAPVE